MELTNRIQYSRFVHCLLALNRAFPGLEQVYTFLPASKQTGKVGHEADSLYSDSMYVYMSVPFPRGVKSQILKIDQQLLR